MEDAKHPPYQVVQGTVAAFRERNAPSHRLIDFISKKFHIIYFTKELKKDPRLHFPLTIY